MGILNNLFGPKRAAETIRPQVPAEAKPSTPAVNSGEVDFETFTSVQLRVGTVRSAEPVPGSDKLLRLSVDLGEDEPRQILSGIAQHVAVEDLVGNQFTFVANLPPRRMMGLESNGMLMATDNADGLVLVAPVKQVPPGSRLH